MKKLFLFAALLSLLLSATFAMASVRTDSPAAALGKAPFAASEASSRQIAPSQEAKPVHSHGAYSSDGAMKNSSAPYLAIVPSSATLNLGQSQQFIVFIHYPNGVSAQVENELLSWSTSGGIGSISPQGLFTSANVGSGAVSAIYLNEIPGLYPRVHANVSVNGISPPPPPSEISYIRVTPDPVFLLVGQSQQFFATAYDESGASLGLIPNSNLSWFATPSIGVIGEDGIFNATSDGSGAVSALYTGAPSPGVAIHANASVTVSLPPSGGTGGSGGAGGAGAGGSYKTSTVLSFTCAGVIGEIKVTVFDSSVKNATVDVLYLEGKRTKVFSHDINGNSIVSFTPEKTGEYELHVSAGADQQSLRFYVPSCGLSSLNSTKNATVRLEANRELMLAKTVDYPGGFSKQFSVYKITEGQSESFETSVTLFFTYNGNSTLSDFDIQDSIPTSVISRTSQITFAQKPSMASSGPKFEWHVRSIGKGGKVSYSYSFARPLTDQMISLFDAPKVRTAAERASQEASQANSDLLAASIGPIFGIKLPLAGLAVGFVLVLAILYFFLFARKRAED
jgi:hypothetical protein